MDSWMKMSPESLPGDGQYDNDGNFDDRVSPLKTNRGIRNPNFLRAPHPYYYRGFGDCWGTLFVYCHRYVYPQNLQMLQNCRSPKVPADLLQPLYSCLHIRRMCPFEFN